MVAACYDHAIAFAEANVEFAERLANIPALNGGAKTPWYHQLRRLRTILAAPRVLLADETGLGKTAVVVLAKLFEELDPEIRAQLLEGTNGASADGLAVKAGPRRIAIIFSTTGGMRDPWNEEEVNSYVPRVFARQHVLHLERIRDSARIRSVRGAAPDTDFVVVNYEKLLFPEVVRALAALIASGAVSLIALDECHQLRNPKAQRFLPTDTRTLSSGFLAILRAMRTAPAMPKLLLLSATPIANTSADLGVLIHLLDPSMRIDAVRATRNLRVLRDLFWQGSTFRLDKQMAKELLGLPELIDEGPTWVPLTDAEADAYTGTWERLIGGGKLRSLAAALFEPKIRFLERRVPRWRAEGAQVVIFSAFKTGVTRELAERLGGVWIDGEIPVAVRDARIRAFREGRTPILIATTKTSAESISLVTGDRPCVVVRFEPFFTPYEWVQTVGRVWRPGQRGWVRVVTLGVRGENLSKRVEAACPRVEERYLLRRRRTWQPTSYDEDALAICEQKRHAADQLYAGHAVTKLMARLLTADSEDQLRNAMRSITFDSPSHRACFLARCWIGRGLDYFTKLVAMPKFARQYAVDYNAHWKYTASAHTGTLIRQVVEEYEQQAGAFTRIVDQGAGPGCSARSLHRSMTAVDLSAAMLRLAQKEIRQLNRRENCSIELTTIVKPIQACGLPDRSADLAIAAYVLQYARQSRDSTGATDREIEQIVLETNRILRRGGLWVIALPYNIKHAMIERFERTVGRYGFDVLPVSGFYRPSLAEDIDGNRRAPMRKVFRGVWLTVARKQRAVTALAELAPQGLSFQPIALPGGVEQRGARQTHRRKRQTPERIVAFQHVSGRGLAELIAASVADTHNGRATGRKRTA